MGATQNDLCLDLVVQLKCRKPPYFTVDFECHCSKVVEIAVAVDAQAHLEPLREHPDRAALFDRDGEFEDLIMEILHR